MRHSVRAAGREDADDGGFAGKMPTTSLRRSLSPLRRQVGVWVCRGLLRSCLRTAGMPDFCVGDHMIAHEGARGTYDIRSSTPFIVVRLMVRIVASRQRRCGADLHGSERLTGHDRYRPLQTVTSKPNRRDPSIGDKAVERARKNLERAVWLQQPPAKKRPRPKLKARRKDVVADHWRPGTAGPESRLAAAARYAGATRIASGQQTSW
jgi:hypothetical protein